MKWQITTGPSLEPVTAVEAKKQLRVEHNDEDDLIQHLISVARRKVEQETGRLLLSQTVNVRWDSWPACGYLSLPYYPVSSVTHVKYLDENGALQTWASSNYSTDLYGMEARIVPNPDAYIPDVGDYPNAVQVEYVAGAAAIGDVPAELKHAILVELTMLYERREDIPLGANTPGVRTGAWLQFGSRKNLL